MNGITFYGGQNYGLSATTFSDHDTLDREEGIHLYLALGNLTTGTCSLQYCTGSLRSRVTNYVETKIPW
jgi:hypothetical protein